MSNITAFYCSDGYDCTDEVALSENKSPTPQGSECPVGHFCQNGEKTPCPAGTYRDKTLATSDAYCLPCKPGYFCEPGTGTFNNTNLCAEGHFCPTGTNQTAMNNNECTPGHFCPSGADREISCPLGSYCPNTTMSEPIICNTGTGTNELCDELGLSSPKVCPEGFICPGVNCTDEESDFDLDSFHLYGCLYKCRDKVCPQFAQPCGKGKYRQVYYK